MNATTADGELLLAWWAARLALAALRGDQEAGELVLVEVAHQDGAAAALLGQLATLNARAAVQLAGADRAEVDLREIVQRLAAEVSSREGERDARAN